MPKSGYTQLTCPGAVDRLAETSGQIRRKRLGTIWRRRFEQRVKGFPVPELTASYWSQAADKLRENEEAARVYLPKDHARRLERFCECGLGGVP